ncbi:MAG: prepilin-type N-terminal cleavage/methylation domain-containing protein [Synergistaceae bacterium]|nr:prepilin-type N-terminal cleavage/methylation domain-containing protein [Synergistaceae bacterium]
MKRMRKGFTLVELLIVVAIMATLTAAITYSISGSTAKAKASTIASNVETFKTIAGLYVANNAGDDISTLTADNLMKAELPAWADLANPGDDDNVVKYTAIGTGPDEWAITVDFSKDPEKGGIRDALKLIKGYGKYYNSDAATAIFGSGTNDTDYQFKVTLMTGKIEPIAAPAAGGGD